MNTSEQSLGGRMEILDVFTGHRQLAARVRINYAF